MINREDFKLMAVGKFCLGKSTIKAEEYTLFLDGALFAFDKINKENNQNVISFVQNDNRAKIIKQKEGDKDV